MSSAAKNGVMEPGEGIRPAFVVTPEKVVAEIVVPDFSLVTKVGEVVDAKTRSGLIATSMKSAAAVEYAELIGREQIRGAAWERGKLEVDRRNDDARGRRNRGDRHRPKCECYGTGQVRIRHNSFPKDMNGRLPVLLGWHKSARRTLSSYPAIVR